MAAEYPPISQEGSNFRKKTAKKCILPPKFQKVRFEIYKKVHEFLEYLRYIYMWASMRKRVFDLQGDILQIPEEARISSTCSLYLKIKTFVNGACTPITTVYKRPR